MLYERGLVICPYSIRHIIRMCLLGNYPTASGTESILCCLSLSHACAGVVRNERMWEAVLQPHQGKLWLASFTCCELAASGTLPQKNLAVARPCIATFSFGHASECSSGCGKQDWKNMMS